MNPQPSTQVTQWARPSPGAQGLTISPGTAVGRPMRRPQRQGQRGVNMLTVLTIALFCFVLGLMVGLLVPPSGFVTVADSASVASLANGKDPSARQRRLKKNRNRANKASRATAKARTKSKGGKLAAAVPVLTDNAPEQLAACLKQGDGARGEIIAEVEVGSHGQVAAVSLLGAEFLQPRQSSCLHQTIRRWSFAPGGPNRFLLRASL